MKTDPKNLPMLSALGVVLARQKRFAEAVQSLAYLGDVYFRRRDFEPSERLLLHALKLEPNIRIAYVDLGAIHSSEKQFEKAVRELNKAIQLDPAQVDAHYRLAATYQAMGRNQEAAEQREKVKTLQQTKELELLHKISGPPPAPAIE
ncbi:MAG: tetratricopeptide repeat protein [Terriglobia bacterium]